ncbi:transglycosylase protein with SLT domain [Homoserinimonas aerilata]|uniref:Transglycosylase protein with SLT domain n=1 Tax=Homoserinimonas aerilata TaxID=1162970 RepID=A0A542YAM0_9MICO|nr:murein transglycosylase [Homoserinimonas aerilata]TQL45004.1 transglycosylase protein with SLT domain [Homoserinimonas aerilata]
MPTSPRPSDDQPDGERSGRAVDWTVVGAISAGVAALAVVGVLVFFVLAPRGDAPAPSEGPVAPAYAAPAELPPAAAVPGPGDAGTADPEWVARVASVAGIPERALAAYAGAARFKASDRPDCGLGWNTLAAIGLVESDHGRHGGSAIGADGTVSPPIIGIALTGEGTAHIPDTDGGQFDGDTEYDRAVGPMQLLPVTWENWHVDGNADGVQDPQNIDDAVIAAANYLCRSSTDMVDEDGWRAGVHAYNRSDEYAHAVADAANLYVEAARQVAG